MVSKTKRTASQASQTMADLLSKKENKINILKKGDRVKAIITQISPKRVYFDIGAKTEGVIFGRELERVRDFIRTAKKEDADIIASSALMTTTMIYMPEMIKQLNEMEIRDQYKIMVGGAPVIKSWADEIGSDGYGLTAKEGVQSALDLME